MTKSVLSGQLLMILSIVQGDRALKSIQRLLLA